MTLNCLSRFPRTPFTVFFLGIAGVKGRERVNVFPHPIPSPFCGGKGFFDTDYRSSPGMVLNALGRLIAMVCTPPPRACGRK